MPDFQAPPQIHGAKITNYKDASRRICLEIMAFKHDQLLNTEMEKRKHVLAQAGLQSD